MNEITDFIAGFMIQIGSLLKIRKSSLGWLVSIFCIIYWMIRGYSLGLYSQTFWHLFSLSMAVYGLVTWWNEEEEVDDED